MTLNGTIKINTELSGYYGNSLGGILGDAYMATTVDVKRGVCVCVCACQFEKECTQMLVRVGELIFECNITAHITYIKTMPLCNN